MSTATYRTSHHAIGHQYDDRLAANPWDRHIDFWHRKHLARMVDLLYPNGLNRYLDFACGTGRLTGVVAPCAKETVGVDISDEMLAGARARFPNARFVCADITTERVGLGRFDLVTAFRFFGNAEWELRESALRAIATMQDRGDVLIVNNHRNPNTIAYRIAQLRGHGLPRKSDGHPIDLTFGEARRLFRRYGYRLTCVAAIGAWAWRASKMQGVTDPQRTPDRDEHSWWNTPLLAHVAPDCVMAFTRQ